MKHLPATLILLLASLTLTAISDSRLPSNSAATVVDQEQTRELQYFPNERAVEFISFGYQNAFADFLWFQTINYFGKHYYSDHNFRWLAHMCNLITTLNPKARHVYEFGSAMLSWEQNEPSESIKLLTKAIAAFPNDWNFLYLRGFTNMFFLKDNKSAREDFITASHIPNAPVFLARMATKNMLEYEDPKLTVFFIESLLRKNSDLTYRSMLEDRLKQAKKAAGMSE